MKNILVLGATGAMGQYLVPILAATDCRIDAVSLAAGNFNQHNVNQIITANAKDPAFLSVLLANNYDAIIDFMIYNTEENTTYLPWLVNSCGQYIYLSSYRVYDNKEVPLRETSPRLLDTADEMLLRLSDDYSIFKARGEDVLKLMPRNNWTIIRPAITYSLMRNQLVTLEIHNCVGRAKQGKTVVVPVQAKNIQATMSWAGDVAQMIARLLFNEAALGEIFTVSTAEHHTWGEIAEYYQDICNMKTLWVEREEFLEIITPSPYIQRKRWQLDYDRLFDRIIDNSKILAATDMKQSELMPLYRGLEYEISRIPADVRWQPNEKMDAYLAARGIK